STTDLVVAVGDVLQLLQDERRDHDGGVDDLGVEHVGNSSINQRAGIQHIRPPATDLFGELDVGDDEPELVAGLQQQGHAQVGQDQVGQHQGDGAEIPENHRAERQVRQPAEHEPDQ
ncbi:MAG: hypothetical protein ACK55I_24525, partial [bacterium]